MEDEKLLKGEKEFEISKEQDKLNREERAKKRESARLQRIDEEEAPRELELVMKQMAKEAEEEAAKLKAAKEEQARILDEELAGLLREKLKKEEREIPYTGGVEMGFFSTLPTENIMLIFEQLRPPEICALRSTCWGLKPLGQDDKLWRNLANHSITKQDFKGTKLSPTPLSPPSIPATGPPAIGTAAPAPVGVAAPLKVAVGQEKKQDTQLMVDEDAWFGLLQGTSNLILKAYFQEVQIPQQQNRLLRAGRDTSS